MSESLTSTELRTQLEVIMSLALDILKGTNTND